MNKREKKNLDTDMKQSELDSQEASNTRGNSHGVDAPKDVVLSQEQYEHLCSEAQRAKQLHEKCLRIQADYDNARKRLAREREEFIKFAQFNIIQDFLSVLDDFERAYDSAKKTKDIDNLIKGLEMIGKDLYGLLRKYGVEEIDALNKAFDPTVHEALMQEDRDDVPENTVVEVLQKGYKLHGKVLRPAKVKVSKNSK